ncbi:MAG: hypothetical protein L6416_08355 [Candidatus Omnitrophica bacterium]|nr:hypothetical protein [Candidatus Omnitrophota bacterium]
MLSYNRVQIFKLFYLGKETVQWTIKTLRYLSTLTQEDALRVQQEVEF